MPSLYSKHCRPEPEAEAEAEAEDELALAPRPIPAAFAENYTRYRPYQTLRVPCCSAAELDRPQRPKAANPHGRTRPTSDFMNYGQVNKDLCEQPNAAGMLGYGRLVGDYVICCKPYSYSSSGILEAGVLPLSRPLTVRLEGKLPIFYPKKPIAINATSVAAILGQGYTLSDMHLSLAQKRSSALWQDFDICQTPSLGLLQVPQEWSYCFWKSMKPDPPMRQPLQAQTSVGCICTIRNESDFTSVETAPKMYEETDTDSESDVESVDESGQESGDDSRARDEDKLKDIGADEMTKSEDELTIDGLDGKRIHHLDKTEQEIKDQQKDLDEESASDDDVKSDGDDEIEDPDMKNSIEIVMVEDLDRKSDNKLRTRMESYLVKKVEPEEPKAKFARFFHRIRKRMKTVRKRIRNTVRDCCCCVSIDEDEVVFANALSAYLPYRKD